MATVSRPAADDTSAVTDEAVSKAGLNECPICAYDYSVRIRRYPSRKEKRYILGETIGGHNGAGAAAAEDEDHYPVTLACCGGSVCLACAERSLLVTVDGSGGGFHRCMMCNEEIKVLARDDKDDDSEGEEGAPFVRNRAHADLLAILRSHQKKDGDGNEDDEVLERGAKREHSDERPLSARGGLLWKDMESLIAGTNGGPDQSVTDERTETLADCASENLQFEGTLNDIIFDRQRVELPRKPRLYRLTFRGPKYNIIISTFKGWPVIRKKYEGRSIEFGAQAKPDVGDILLSIQGYPLPFDLDLEVIMEALQVSMRDYSPVQLVFAEEAEFQAFFANVVVPREEAIERAKKASGTPKTTGGVSQEQPHRRRSKRLRARENN